MKIYFFSLLLLLSSCSALTGQYQEPGFSAYCNSHPHVGTCP